MLTLLKGRTETILCTNSPLATWFDLKRILLTEFSEEIMGPEIHHTYIVFNYLLAMRELASVREITKVEVFGYTIYGV